MKSKNSENLNIAKLNVANDFVDEFIQKNSWVHEIQSIEIDSTVGDSLPGYDVKNMIFKNNVEKFKDEKEIIREEFIELFSAIKEEVDRGFLYHQRDKGKHVVGGTDFPDVLKDFVLKNIR